jgi:hypothetical protein
MTLRNLLTEICVVALVIVQSWMPQSPSLPQHQAKRLVDAVVVLEPMEAVA